MARYLGQFRPEFSRVHRDPDLNWFAPFSLPYLVGVIGDRFSGKSTLMTLLAENHGFRVFTLGAQLREIAFRRGVSVRDRTALGEFAAEVRSEYNDGAVLARLLLRRIRAYQQGEAGALPLMDRIAIGGIKHSEELKILQRISSFTAFEVHASPELRAERAHQNGQLEALYDRLGGRGGTRYGDLTSGQRIAFFVESVDVPEHNGVHGRFEARFAGGLADVRTALDAARTSKVPNDHQSLPRLEEELDSILHREKPGIVQIGW